MANILLVEPDYRSKFPPLGLMRISTYHKERGDSVTFTRGRVRALKESNWHRIYVSSLFTYELPRTISTIRYYVPTVDDPRDIVVGGIGATLMPNYIRERVPCTVVEGPLDRPNMLGPDTPAIAHYLPDYGVMESVSWKYRPEDSYFCRVTKGCVRRCKFCAVPRLEPTFGYSRSLKEQVREVKERFGEKQHLVLMDNNLLATDRLGEVIDDIRAEGFQQGAVRNGRKRAVDFNQGIDARLITPQVAKLLSSICLSPVRLAIDYDAMKEPYTQAIHYLKEAGFARFTNYVMFNFDDDPYSFYTRLRLNIELSKSLGIRVTGFPMRYVPVDDVNRRYVSKGWHWRYLRGLQCILHATRGLVSPNPPFFDAAFGRTFDEFLEIVSMPDQYIIQRNHYATREADEWRRLFRQLDTSERTQFMLALAEIHRSQDRLSSIKSYPQYRALLGHYYPTVMLNDGP